MVNIANPGTKFYALLIGINYYEPNPYYESLKGAVRDIDLVDTYLRDTLNIPQEQITRLTSPIEEESNLQAIRAKRQEEILPSYENIVKAFDELTQKAKPGDLVYIHYSGHGGQAKTIFPEIKPDKQDEGIVPRDIGESGRYLRDVEIATLLKRMTDKGLIVSVVFDSCHSGGATRGDYAIRGIAEVDNSERTEQSLVAAKDELMNNWKQLTTGHSMDGWLPNQKNYVFLAACRPSESAYEYAIHGKERHGALTYWMIDTLRNSTSELTYQSLYSRVKGMIQSKFSNQLPMLLGEGDRLVFGDKTVSTYYTVNLIKVNTEQTEVTLDAGAAQGLTTGTQFAIYPFNTRDFANKEQVLAAVEITKVQGSTSIAKVLLPGDGGIEVKGKLEPGCPALILAAPINLIRRVRFYLKEAGEQEHQLPPDLVQKQETALQAVRDALADNGWVVEVKEGEEGDYQVAVGREGEYEICIGMPLKNLRPPLMIDDAAAPEIVVKRLVHLAKYQATAELDNPNSKLSQYLEYELLDQNKQPFPDQNNIVLESGTVCLRLKNNYFRSLNIAILDLEPTWGIFQIDIEDIDAPFYELASGEVLELDDFEFKAPEGVVYEQAKETLKVFVVKGLANFKWLTLPPLDEEQQDRGYIKRELDKKKEELIEIGVQRGEELEINPLDKLLTTIGAEINEPPKINRSFRRKPNSNTEWTSKEIQVTVKTTN
ncbi:caspase family protein [Dapis sp. BLCC M229]|uniref:caspase family protein n=1 Tax=Dapis sp. BLCC M229 TaxID=3400188 RepID=UPI003CF9D37F